MSMRKTALLLAAGVMGAMGPARPAAAQDIEVAAQARGIRLPDGYYARLRRDPQAFELQRGWRSYRDTHAPRGGAPDGRSSIQLPNTGELRMVVVMTLFSDSPQPPFATSVTQQQLFGANPLGNLTELYREMSGGRVNLTGTVQPWVRTNVTRAAAVGASFGLENDARMGDYLVSALTQLDPSVNFAQYDNNGPDGVPNSADDDGYVDVAVFQYTEVAASCGVPNPGPWPHRYVVRAWTGQPFRTGDLRPNGQPILVDDYIIQSVVDCGGEPQSIATIAHETGHAFGLPDFYHSANGILPSQRRWVLGCWALMAAGSWGCGDGASFGKVSKPPHMGAYEKVWMGWASEIDAGTAANATFTLPPVQTSGTVLRVPLRGLDEYVLLEYRPNTGFDSGLPAGGVLAYHVEPGRPLFPCVNVACPRLYQVALKEADGNGALVLNAEEGGNRGEAGDIFTGTRILSDATTPSLRLNTGWPSNVALKITVQADQARVQVLRIARVPTIQLLGTWLGTAPPSADQQVAIDALGNHNDRLDLGDIRAYIRNNPGME